MHLSSFTEPPARAAAEADDDDTLVLGYNDLDPAAPGYVHNSIFDCVHFMCFKPSSGSGGLTRCVCSSPIRTGFQDPDMPPPPLDGEGAAATATAAE